MYISLVPFIMFQADKALGAQATMYPRHIQAVFFLHMAIHGFSLGEGFLTDWTIHAIVTTGTKKMLVQLVKGF